MVLDQSPTEVLRVWRGFIVHVNVQDLHSLCWRI